MEFQARQHIPASSFDLDRGMKALRRTAGLGLSRAYASIAQNEPATAKAVSYFRKDGLSALDPNESKLVPRRGA